MRLLEANLPDSIPADSSPHSTPATTVLATKSSSSSYVCNPDFTEARDLGSDGTLWELRVWGPSTFLRGL